MAIDIAKINPQILADIRARGRCDAAIAVMSPAELFQEWCEWNGIIGFAYTILDTVDNLRAAEVK